MKISLHLIGNQYNKSKHLSEEQKQKQSERQMGENNPNYGNRWHQTEESKRKIGESCKTILATPEIKQKMSDSKMGEKNHFYGKSHTAETKQKISEYTRTKETRQKMSRAAKMCTPEHNRKISNTLKEYYKNKKA